MSTIDSSVCSTSLEIDIDIVRSTLLQFLEKRQSPKTICPSEAARGLPAQELDKLDNGWRDAMPIIREVLFAMRDANQVEILQKGQVLPMETRLEDIKGPIRARLV